LGLKWLASYEVLSHATSTQGEGGVYIYITPLFYLISFKFCYCLILREIVYLQSSSTIICNSRIERLGDYLFFSNGLVENIGTSEGLPEKNNTESVAANGNGR
jgi:hypothetical protein